MSEDEGIVPKILAEPDEGAWTRLVQPDLLRYEERVKVLFVCSGNTCRSPMAEIVLRDKCPEWSVSSAGLSARQGSPASKHALKVVAERGLDLSRHRSRNVKDLSLAEFDKVFALAQEHLLSLPDSCEAVLLSSLLEREESIVDPFGGDLEVYRETFAQICLYLDSIEKIRDK